MRCNPLRWLWGLPPLVALAWVAALAEKPRLEADLKARAEAALASRGLTWATADFSAREGAVAGLASEESEKAQAVSLVSSVWGVRTTEDRTSVLETIRPYIWSATRGDKALSLTGYVPNPAAKTAVVNSAKTAFPNYTIQDQLKLARGAPEQSEFLGGTAFALKQLAGLKQGGKAALEANGLVVEGEAETAASFNTVKTALGGAMPKGIVMKSDKVVAPAVKPYTWAVSHKGSQLELTGHVPSKSARDALVADAKKVFPRASVGDRMTYGSGEPRDWQKVAAAALARLGQLNDATVEMRDTDVKVVGFAEREELVETVRRGLRADVHSPFKLDEQIRLDPRVIAEREARAKAEAEARAKAEAEAKARAEAEERRRSEEDAQRQAAARAAEAQRTAAASDAAQRAAADAAARQKAAEDAARQRAAADEAARQRAQAEEAQRRAAETAARLTAEARRCQDDLRAAASAGVINFQRASADLDRRSNSTLDRLAEIVKGCSNATIEVGGHTDAEGEPDRKQKLSERRARAVVDHLIKAGVPEAQIHAVGYGDSKPVAPNDTPDNRAKNRRIEFSVRAR